LAETAPRVSFSDATGKKDVQGGEEVSRHEKKKKTRKHLSTKNNKKTTITSESYR